MNFKEFLQDNIVYLDGGMGTLLQRAGLGLGELPEVWNLTHPETVTRIHTDYFNAGSNVVATNTFGANALKFDDAALESIVRAAVENAKRARELSKGSQPKFIALDIGPSGKMFKPYGDLDFEDGVALFARIVRLGVKYGVDLILIETMGDSYEMKAALLAAKENSELPVLVSCAYGEDSKLMTGASPEAMVALCEGMGADAVGVNCSLGPKQMTETAERLLNFASLPVLVKPNAGLPAADGAYDIDEREFAARMAKFAEQGAVLLGGCCGTTPSYISALVEATKGVQRRHGVLKTHTCISSYTHALTFETPVLIGERINPTGKKRFRQALENGEVGYILKEGIAQQEKGAHALDVNVGAPGIDEKTELPRYVRELQAVTDLPLQLDTSDPVAMERAMRIYNGKPLVNSVSGKKASMDAILPLVKKYGGVVIALTLDENGIPDTAEGRVAIARTIVAEAAKYGIEKRDIIVDPLAMAVSADKNAAQVTLTALRELTALGLRTSLGVSNISFGLPSRDTVNAAFFALALENGLSAAIMNPHSVEMMKAYHAFRALKGMDESCGEYVRFATEVLPAYAPVGVGQVSVHVQNEGERTPLQTAIEKGLREEAVALCDELLKTLPPLELVEGEIVPALDRVGKAYEEKRAFLPQLLMSADGAQAAFERVKTHIANRGGAQVKKCKVVLATVQGDIHDIGKNIVSTLLGNYGFEVVDLGKDVPPERIVEETVERGAPIVGLSALMTTTLPSMERTVALLRERAPQTKIVVGGAVLTEEYAKGLGADGYGKDGMATVRFAEEVYAKLK